MNRHSAIKLLCILFFTGYSMSGKTEIPLSDSLDLPMKINTKSIKKSDKTVKETKIREDSSARISNYLHHNTHSEQMYDSLRNKNFKKKWMRELSNIVILPPDSLKEPDKIPTLRSEVNFVEYDGMIIRSIRFVKLDVFGPNILDTSIVVENWLARTGNNVHIKTSDRVLERHLLFTVGDKIDSRELSDNERIFRELSFIEDARIIVNRVEGLEGYVDVAVITKDRWSKAFYLDLSDINTGKLELWDRNLFGSGNEFQNNIHWNPDKKGLLGYEGFFTNRNIYGTFIDGEVQYKKVYETESFGVQFDRKFFTPNTKYAGGASAFHTSTIHTIVYSEISRLRVPVDYNYSNVWIGRAFYLNKSASVEKNRLNLITASRIYKENYFNRPSVTPNSFYRYHKKTVWLNSIALSSQSFFRSSLIYNYGRTEDIPIGYLANLTFGPEFGEFKNRFYTSLSLSKGFYISNLGYLYGQVSEGRFYIKDNGFEQAMYQYKLKYFTNLFIIRQFKYRHFVGINYTRGINRYDYENINLNDQEGIRGFSQASVTGNKKLVLNFETVAFTPYYLLGFRFVGFGFLDIGKIAAENKSILDVHWYSGLGFGIRIENERLVFPTFELRFAYYPNLPEMAFDELFRFYGEKKLNPDNFYVKNPSILSYH